MAALNQADRDLTAAKQQMRQLQPHGPSSPAGASNNAAPGTAPRLPARTKRKRSANDREGDHATSPTDNQRAPSKRMAPRQILTGEK